MALISNYKVYLINTMSYFKLLTIGCLLNCYEDTCLMLILELRILHFY